MKLVLCLMVALLCGGCFVFDEIEQGQAIMAAHSPKSERQEDPAKPDGVEGAGKTARERLTEYYAKQRAKAGPPKTSDDPGDSIGQCRIGSSTSFLRRYDCQLRGGTFL
jgi:hypothetical protein